MRPGFPYLLLNDVDVEANLEMSQGSTKYSINGWANPRLPTSSSSRYLNSIITNPK